MKTIITLDQHELGLFSADDGELTWTRRAARGVLTNDKAQTAMMHFTKTGVCKLPGGGMEDNETIEVALRREIREETGYEITDIRELGMVEENRQASGMHQLSYCYMARVTDFVGTDLTEKEAGQGMELVWVDTIDAAIEMIRAGQEQARVDEDGSAIGVELMAQRDCAILEAAKAAAEPSTT